jgi:hypothetical protein
MLMIAEGLLIASQRAPQLQGRDVLGRACDLYHLDSAIAGWEAIDEPRLFPAVRALIEFSGELRDL